MNLVHAPLRILFHHRVAAADGMRVHITELVEALRADGHEVLIVGPSSADGDDRAGDSTKLERLADLLRRLLPAAAFETLELAYNIPAYWRLRAAAKAFKPDVIYERYNLFLLAGLLLKRQLKLPLLIEINSPLAEERIQFGGLQLKGLGRRCEKALWQGADIVLPVTHVLAKSVRELRENRPLAVIPNGANLRLPKAMTTVKTIRLRLGLEKDALVLGFVGFVRAWHGLDWAVEALPQLPPRTHLVVVGDGPAAADLKLRAAELGIADRVHLVGRVPHHEVPGYMQTFDVALQTAAVPYASPLKLFEYMALRKAVVAPDQPNMREVLDHEHNALLFAPGERSSFIEALQRLSQDPELRARLSDNARRTICERPFTWAHNASRIADLSRALCDVPEPVSADVAAATSTPQASYR